MKYTHLAAVAWLFALGLFLAPAGAAASDNGNFRLDVDTALPGFEQFGMREELPNYWKNWTKESAFARNTGVNLRSIKGDVIEKPEIIEPRMVRSEESQAKELTLSDVGMGTLKIVGTVILAPIVVTGYVGFLFIEGLFVNGASFGFG
ncbi:MAG: hypothetical protein ACRBM6_35880 [Geminicoccales bacterium]